MTGPYSGGCQCGAIRFSVSSLGLASLCHCRMCQKAFAGIGGALVTAVDLTWTRGTLKHFASSNKVRRGFCGNCGTPLTFEYDETIDIAIAAFDRANEIAPTIQLGTGSKLPWTDSLAALPIRSPEAAAQLAAFHASIVSNQHPDHDTHTWPVMKQQS
jgi:hypothetical protein